MTILIVSTIAREGQRLATGLKAQNYAIETARTGKQALTKVSVNDYDIIVLDHPQAREIIPKMREKKIDSGIIALLDKRDGSEAADVLDAGADDCLAKPFPFFELSARIRALLRRERRPQPTKLEVGDLILDPTSHAVWRGEKRVRLSRKEYRLLDYLMRRAGHVCTYNMIGERVWGYDVNPSLQLIRVYIGYLRRKIGEGFSPKLIHTVEGVGYKLEDRTRSIKPNNKLKALLAGLNFLL